MTYGDIIRTMEDTELAEFLHNVCPYIEGSGEDIEYRFSMIVGEKEIICPDSVGDIEEVLMMEYKGE